VKTISLKKVSAVAVASLGFGLLSVVPANATTITAWTVYEANVTKIALATATATPVTNVAVYVNVGATTIAVGTDGASATTGAVAQLRGVLTSYPAGGFVPVSSSVNVAGASAGTPTVPTGGLVAVANTGVTGASGVNSIYVQDGDDAAGLAVYDVAATATTGLASMSFTPTIAGSYVLTVWNDGPAIGAATIGNNAVDSNEAVQTIAITVAAESTYSNTLSTAFITPGLGGTGADYATTPAIATADVAVSASATMAAAARASITVKLFDSSNTAMAAGKVTSITAEVSGPGGVIVNANDVPAAPSCSTTLTAPNGRSVAFTSEDEINHVYVCADGTAGVATIKVSVTDINGVKSTLATKTVTFFGKVKTIAATGVLTVGTAAGGTTGNPAAARTSSSIIPSIIVKATDSASNPVSGLTFTYKSSNTAVMTETLTCNEDIAATANTSSSGGSGFYNCQVTSSSGAKSGDKATLTVRIADPADATGLTFLTSDVAFTIGGSATTGTETIAFDKTSYAPGEAMVITRTAKDSAGNPVADGTASPTYSFNKGITGTPAAGAYAKGVSASASSVAKSTIFAPVTPGSFIVTATAANGATITATASVTDANAALLTQIDALNAKIVALNALIAKIMKKLGVK